MLSGRTYLLLTLPFCVSVLLLSQFKLSIFSSLILFTLLVVSIVYRNAWLLLYFDSSQTDEAIQQSLSMVLAKYVKTKDNYVITMGDVVCRIQLMPLLPSVCLLTFKSNWGHNKAGVIKKLLRKKIEPVVPRLVLRTGDKHDKDN